MKYIPIILIVVLVSCPAWAWDVKVDKSSIAVKEECVVIDVNGKTQIKVCKCGSVSVQEWKEVVKNKDPNNTIQFNEGTTYLYVPTR